MGIAKLMLGFKNPGKKFRLAPYWFWNYKLEDEKLKWQIREMKRKGIGGFVMHARPGLLTPYMSDEWFKSVETSVREAERLDMFAWLFDEDGWPSGAAGGRITEEHPEYRMSQIYVAREIDLAGPLRWRKDLKIEDEIKFIYAVQIEDGRIKDVPGRVIDIFRYLKKGEIEWDVPRGRWKVVVIARNVFRGTFFGYYPDLLNKDAIKKFIEYTHKVYFEKFGRYMGRVIPGIFFDEPGMQYTLVKRSIPWTGDIPRRFRRDHGYDLGRYILGLFYDIGTKTGKVRCDYYEAVTGLYVEAFFKQIYDYCKKNNLLSIGHVVCESELFLNVKNQGDFFRTAEYMHWGGVDSLGHQLLPEGSAPYPDCNLIATKMAASSSHYFGKQRVMNEAFGIADGWKLNLRTMKALADWQVILGSNYFIPHAFFYTLEGFRKWECSPDHFYRSPYWRHYRLFADYLARLCHLFTGAKHIADAAILYPVRTVWAERNPESTPAIESARKDFENVSCLFMRLHRDFDYVTEEMIQGADVEGGEIRVKAGNGRKGEAFKILVFPSVTTVSRKTLKNIGRFCEGGGILLLTNCLPSASEEKGEDKVVLKFFQDLVVQRENAVYFKAADFRRMKESLIKILKEAGDSDVSIVHGGGNVENVVYCHYQKGSEDIYFFSNTSEYQKYSAGISLKSNGKIWEANAFHGNLQLLTDYKEESGKVMFNLDFEPTQSHLIIVSREKAGVPGKDDRHESGVPDVIKLGNEWRFRTERLNALPLTEWKLKMEGRHGWGSIFHRYETDVWVNAVPEKAKLFIDSLVDEKIWNDCSVKPVTIEINGNPVVYPLEEFGYLRVKNRGIKKSAYLDALGFQWETRRGIEHYLRKGRNVITVETFGGVLEPAKLGEMMVLIGSFAVSQEGKKCFVDRERGRIRTGSWCKQGYPFYSGIGIYEQKVSILNPGKKMVLCLDKVADLADVRINGRPAGILAWEPFKIDVTRYLRPGENEVIINVANTLYNIFHRQSHPSGLLEEVRIEKM